MGKACNNVGDFDDEEQYLKRAKEGYQEQLGRDSEKALEATYSVIVSTGMSHGKRIEKYRDLVKRMERALGEENVVTFETINTLGNNLYRKGEYEEAKEVHERCLAGRMMVLGEDHQHTLSTLNNWEQFMKF